MDSLVHTEEHRVEGYSLLTPKELPPREGQYFQRHLTYRDISHVLRSLQYSQFVAVDFETRGGDWTTDIEIVGLGLSWEKGSGYFDWADLSRTNRQLILETLAEHRGLLAHNIYFDGGVFLKYIGRHPSWHMCTYALYAMLANEGWAGRAWGLKTAQTELLLWKSSNEVDLDKWLVVNGYYKGPRRKDSSLENLEREWLAGSLKPEKGEMWRAPADILGKYCILDAESCYLLYTEVLRPTYLEFPGLVDFVENYWIRHILIHIDQRMHGILMDVPGLHARKAHLEAEISKRETEFLTHPNVLPQITKMEEEMLEPLVAKEPARYKKDGGQSKVWEKWQERVSQARSGQLPEYRFNINSGVQLSELLYNRMGYAVEITTETSKASTAAKALSNMGDIGLILTQRMDCVKELSYIDKYIELTRDRPTIHPSFRLPGTTTGRLSSKEPNLQQVSKTKAMMSLFLAPPGRVWIDLDFSALEPVVTTEFSNDPNMFQIYGDGKPANDIYIFVMSSIPGMGERARALGYDPYNPTKEALARVKKEMKKERSICKTVALACAYGAGVNKVHMSLSEQGIDLSYDQVRQIHEGYWNLFSGVKDFGRSLFFEWRRQKGYVLNGFGRPMAVPADYEKDLLNRFIQSTGHDVLTMYAAIVADVLTEEGLDWRPVIMDFHDAITVDVPEEDGQRAAELLLVAMDRLNQKLGGNIKLKGVPVVGRNLAEVKEPES